MIAILSPAKTLDYATPLPPVQPSVPRFAEDATNLAVSAAKLGPKRPGRLSLADDRAPAVRASHQRRPRLRRFG
jgi:hypothetical protein